MQSLHEVNPEKDTASNSEIMFMVLHASGLTLIPVSIIAQRVILKSHDATSVFIPLLITTFVATITAMIVVAIKQRINLFQPVIVLWVGGITFLLALLIVYMRFYLTKDGVNTFSKIVSNGLIFLIFIVFIVGGLWKKVNVYDSFIEGAKQGFDTAIKIIPYLVGMLVAISVLRTSGVFDYMIHGMKWGVGLLGLNTDFVEAMPTALMKPLSGSGARGMMIDSMKQYGPDSFKGILSCLFQGSADTTFYIVALYFGSVGIKQTRYAIPAALLADLAGVITAIFIAYLFFH
jgi:spore maturation protein SpmB